jgi:3'-phosphoadenosine 5'-phosphosulfate sulfotransferase (PAPS reductase)/FAD synthetase
MESAAMLVLERERILDIGAIVHFADTGKQFPEMAQSIAQIESRLGLRIVTVPRRISFDEFLFEKGGMLRKGCTDCSRRMKRSNLNRHMKSFPPPYDAALGFNAGEDDRARDFVARNERDWLHWFFPLLERGIEREQTWDICRNAGFSILVGMYEKMGRFDCYFCPNQRPSQAKKVAEYYPHLAQEWLGIEERKGHSILSVPFKILTTEQPTLDFRGASSCSCFGGTDCIADEIEAT